MTEPKKPAAKRPARKRSAAPKPAAPKPEETATAQSQFVELFEKIGLGPALLVAGAYAIFVVIIQPLANTYKEAIDEVADTNAALRETVQKNNQEDAERVREIVEQFEKVHSRLDAIKTGVDRLSPISAEVE